MTTRLILVLALVCTPAAALAERAMTCTSYDIVDPSRVHSRIDIHQGDSGAIAFTQVAGFSGTFFASNDPDRAAPEGALPGPLHASELLLAHTTSNGADGDRFTTLAILDRWNAQVDVPVTWLIDWVAPSAQRIVFSYLPGRDGQLSDPVWRSFDDEFTCEITQ